MAEPHGKRILVVDDANLVRRFYRDALERAGFDVDEALNGVEALEKILSATYELIVVDVNMPQMDGLTFIKVLRRQSTAVSSLPTLVISTESSAQDASAARAAGANYYLVKPVSQDQLVEHALIMCGLPA
jgi:two-component system, chemotaxis family, chemotaxis protein CheY